jgi:hypothetical protein
MRDTPLFSIKKDARSAKIQLQSNPHLRTKSRRACAEAALRAAAILVRPGEATVILAYLVAVLASRETDSRFSAYAAT